jgi:hypothetical protein
MRKQKNGGVIVNVSNLQRSNRFYRDIVGLQPAVEASERNAAFFGISDPSYSSSDIITSYKIRVIEDVYIMNFSI